MRATELYFPLVLFIMRYKVVLTFEFLDEILIVLFIMLFEEVLTFEDEIAILNIQIKTTEKQFSVVVYVCFICLSNLRSGRILALLSYSLTFVAR